VTIRAVRIYLYYADKATGREMARRHFGVMYWFKARLKDIREQLRGPEAKGVNIVNFCFRESVSSRRHRESWARLMNAFEYEQVFDLQSLVEVDPVDNIQRLLPIVLQVCESAPWPQVRAIGAVLETPLSAADVSALRVSLEKWSAELDAACAGEAISLSAPRRGPPPLQ
jgi:hypothetical protein